MRSTALARSTARVDRSPRVSRARTTRGRPARARDGDGDDRDNRPEPTTRRKTLALALGCACCARGSDARAMVRLIAPDDANEATFDVERSTTRDEAFAKGMATMMDGFEDAARARKRALIDDLLAEYDGAKEMTVCEIGAGSAPNARYYANASRGPETMDWVGVDPNDSMRAYAEENVAAANDGGRVKINARYVHGVGEALPLPDASADAVVSTLTLCSVLDQGRTLREIRRVLKPGGKFLFLEHVLSRDPSFARLQIALTPMQISVADGCHLDRRTLDEIEDGGLFSSVNAEYYELDGFWVIAPQVAGIAVA
jgi:ubiquinone/menaquinone biosynthesis C-methylase UbiE